MNFDAARNRMVDDQLIPRGISEPRVLSAMRKVPRHLFVEEALQGRGVRRLCPANRREADHIPAVYGCFNDRGA